ncbi:MAG: hypothetical protein P4K86_04570 [Terracidiphilus sp.]|nr:hypothetical protein [Terracidiphilus sp.]
MQLSPQSAPTPLQVNGDQSEGSSRRADFVYQTVTVVAMLLLLCSLWIF